MLLANRQVAQEISSVWPQLALLRRHPPPEVGGSPVAAPGQAVPIRPGRSSPGDTPNRSMKSFEVMKCDTFSLSLIVIHDEPPIEPGFTPKVNPQTRAPQIAGPH